MKGYGSAELKALVEPGAGATALFFPSFMFCPGLIHLDVNLVHYPGSIYYTLGRAFICSSPLPENSKCLQPRTAVPLHRVYAYFYVTN